MADVTVRVEGMTAEDLAIRSANGEPIVEPTLERRPSDRPCGSCSLCCKSLKIAELHKPGGVWCQHAAPGKGGCSIFASPDRPEICRGYECAWKQSPRDGAGSFVIPDIFRPDRVHAIIDQAAGPGNETTLRVVVEPHYADAWRTGQFGAWLRGAAGRGATIVVLCNGNRIATIKRRTQT